MAILGSKNWLIDDDLQEKSTYTIPAMIRNSDSEKEMSLKKSIFISAILHPTLAGAICIVVFILAFMGITFSIFDRPKPKMNDIEFVLVNNAKEQMPLNKKTPYRSDKNTRTGGKRDPKRAVSMPSPTPAKKSVAQKQSSAHKEPHKVVQKKVPKQAHPQNIFKSIMQPKAAPQAKPQPHPTRPQLRPSLKPPSTPRPTMKPSSPFTVPIPKASAPTGRSYSTGPIGGHGTSSSASGGTSGARSSYRGGNYAPTPSLAPTGGGSSSGSRMSRGGSGYGQSGNPGGGGGNPGIDSLKVVDFGPYMRELSRRIKMNWDPPKGNDGKKVVLLFKIAKSGRLLSVSVLKSSGLPNFDKAAINAVELTAPFRPLPAGCNDSSIDIHFTFDYNVLQATSY